jgi:phage repressor protein C with HTH and peptisase S24 domain
MHLCNLFFSNAYAILRRMNDLHRDAAIAYVDSLVRETGLDLTNLARRAGVSSTTLTRFHNDPGYTNSLSARTLKKLSDVTGIPLPPSLGGAANGGPVAPGALNMQAVPQPGPRDLPVVGNVRGGQEGYFFDNGLVQSYVERPWFLLGQSNAYAVYVNDGSMDPAMRHGQLIYVSPTVPPAPGDDVVVQLNDGQGLIKRLLRRTGRHLMLEQFNPAKRLEIPMGSVRSVHLVVAVLKVRT